MIGKISLFIIVLSIMLLTIIHLYFWLQMIKLQESNKKNIVIPDSIDTHNSIDIVPIVQQQIPVAIPPDAVRSYDYRKLYDPLEDPTTRVDRYLLGPIDYRRMFNYPTQGYPDTYRWLGILICDEDEPKNKIIKLFGRQKYPNSNDYQYYTMINMDHDQIKVHIHRRKELYDGDEVEISELGKKYKVQLNKDDDMRYAF